MDLSTAQQMVMRSAPEDWHAWEVMSPDQDEWERRATYRTDIALELSWGRLFSEDIRGPWNEKLGDRPVLWIFVEATYARSPVLKATLFVADGGRYVLPQLWESPEGSGQIEANENDLPLARLIHGLRNGQPGSDPDSALKRFGIGLRPWGRDWSAHP